MSARRSSRRVVWLRLLAAIALPLALLAGIEAVLRLAGVGYDTAFFKKVRIGGRDFFVNNDDFVRRFFPAEMMRLPPAIRMAAEKPPGTCRIFILGESAALGDPSPPYGAGRYLQALLEDRYPTQKFEVVNVSITAINSHVILPLARECARHDGDFWIIYMGNNEMVGPFGAATVFGAQSPALWSVRLRLALLETRLGQLLATVTGPAKSASWGGMEMFVGNQVPPGDPRRQQVYRNFQANLHDILQAGLDGGARVVLNTVAVNLKDCPPFASANALAEYHRGEFQRACDDDALPFRADSRINAIIRQTAQNLPAASLTLCDAGAPQTLTGATNKLPGDDLFYEHVHFNFNGNYRLGRAWAECLAKWLPATNSSWATQQSCERRLALTDWNRGQTWSEVLRRRQQPPLNQQENNAAECAELRRKLSSLGARLTRDSAAEARRIYTDAIARAPEDYQLRFNYGDFLDMIGDAPEAITQWRAVQELLPMYYLGYFQEGRVEERIGHLDDAAACFRRTVQLYPRMTAAWFELSNIHASQGDYPAALDECQRASRLEPSQPAFHICLGKLFTRMNNQAAAAEEYRHALALDPSNAPARDYFANIHR